jgi:hypothetical protein
MTSRTEPACSCEAGSQPPHALVVLGEVDELEPAREGADERVDRVELEAGDQVGELVGRVLVAVAGALGELDGLLVEFQRLVAARGAQDVLEHAAQERPVLLEVAHAGEAMGHQGASGS